MAQKFNAAGRRVTAKAVNVTDLISKITLGCTAEIQPEILKEVAATEHRFNEEWLEKKRLLIPKRRQRSEASKF